MSRSIHEPSLGREVTRTRFLGKDTRQKPHAFRWWEPECTIGDDGCTGEEPVLLNDWQQPTLAGLQKFAFRLNVDGDIQFYGTPDASGGAVTDTVLVRLPGLDAGDVNFLPESGDLTQPIIITEDNGVTFRLATAHIDATTGDVTVIFGPADIAGPSDVYHSIADVGLNEDEIIGAPAFLTGYYICNIGATFAYVKLYDMTGTPDAATDTPVMTLGIPPLSAANIGFDSFPEFTVGLGIATTSGIADDDATDVAFRQLATNIYFTPA